MKSFVEIKVLVQTEEVSFSQCSLFISSQAQVSSTQPIIAAAKLVVVALERGLAPRGVEMEALDVPGKADAAVAVGDALGAEEGWLVVKLPIHSFQPTPSDCFWQQLDNSQCRASECPEVQSMLLLSQMHDSVVVPSLIHVSYLN